MGHSKMEKKLNGNENEIQFKKVINFFYLDLFKPVNSVLVIIYSILLTTLWTHILDFQLLNGSFGYNPILFCKNDSSISSGLIIFCHPIQ